MMRLLLLLMSGCSFAFTHAPEPEKPCNFSEAAPIADAAFAVTYAIFAFELIKDATSSSYNASDDTGPAIGTALFAAIHGGAAAYGFNNVGKCSRHDKELYEQQEAEAAAAATPRVSPSRRDAWQLTKQAAIAARNGDCSTVTALEQVVLRLDTEFHGTVFMRDSAIVRCMQTTELPVQPPGETPPTPAPAPVTAP